MKQLFSNAPGGTLTPWEKTGDETVLASKFGLKLVTQDFVDPIGKKDTYAFCKKASGVTVVPILKNGNLVVTKQYKQGSNAIFWEFPAGTLVNGGSSEGTAIVELAEETGLRACQMIPLGSAYVAPRKIGTREDIYVALECSFGSPQPGDGEFLEVYEILPSDFTQIIREGKDKVSGFTEIALFRAIAHSYLPLI